MAKHRLNRRKPNVTPMVKTTGETTAPKRKPRAHSKSYYKPKIPKVKANATKAITPANTKSEIKAIAKLKRKQERLKKKQYKSVKKKARKLYRELRREQKALARQHTKIRQPKQYTVEYDVSRETPTETTYTVYDRDDHFRTVETPEIDDINYSLDDTINLIQSVHDEIQSKWDERGEYFREYDIASALLNAIFWLEEAKSLPYESKEAIVNQLASSQDLDRVTDIVMLEDYNAVIESCMDIANTIMSVVESVRG